MLADMTDLFLLSVLLTSLVCNVCSQPINDEYDMEVDSRIDVLSRLKEWVRHTRLDLSLPINGELFEGDMVMDYRLRRAVKGVKPKRSAMVGSSYRWPAAFIPYEFDTTLVDEVHDGIIKAIKTYEKYTCMRFVPRLEEKDYVVFMSKPHVCSSNVGRQGGRQNITLGSGCSRLGTILHEMMHCIGIVHEQSRPDRDRHVIVVKENIEKKFLHNFEKYSYGEVDNLDVPYNYASVMHYRNNAFTRNGELTLIARNAPALKFGQRTMFSKGDIEQINKLYSCGKGKRNKGADDFDQDRTVVPNLYDSPDFRL